MCGGRKVNGTCESTFYDNPSKFHFTHFTPCLPTIPPVDSLVFWGRMVSSLPAHFISNFLHRWPIYMAMKHANLSTKGVIFDWLIDWVINFLSMANFKYNTSFNFDQHRTFWNTMYTLEYWIIVLPHFLVEHIFQPPCFQICSLLPNFHKNWVILNRIFE